MDFADVMETRRSVRNYDPSKQITQETLDELFRLVSLTPSSYNLQPWKFIVVQDKENKKRLRTCANDQQHVEDASATVIVLGTKNPAAYADTVSADRMKNGTMDAAKKEKFDAAVARISTHDDIGKGWTFRSTSLACMSFMLAATHLGLASCPIEGFDKDAVRREFKIPKEYEIVMLITLGYATGKMYQRPMRFGKGEIVFYELFGKSNI